MSIQVFLTHWKLNTIPTFKHPTQSMTSFINLPKQEYLKNFENPNQMIQNLTV